MTQEAHPETLYLSACLHDGVFNPTADGFIANDFVEHEAVMETMADYARLHHGQAPSLSMVVGIHPTFPYIAGVGMEWARKYFSDYVLSERFRHMLTHAAHLTAADKTPEALAYLADQQRAITRGIAGQGEEAELWRPPDITGDRCPVPDGPLPSLTYGGHEPGQLWLLSARTSVGKSWLLIQHAVTAVEGGWDVVFFSLEMPVDDVMRRMMTVSLREDFTSAPASVVVEAHQKWVSKHSAKLVVRGPQHGLVTPATLASVAAPRTLIVVDYIGLMKSNSGERAVSDWRVMGAISNDVKTVTLSERVPILAAVQANRSAASQRPGASHKLETLSQSDMLAQDADLHIALDPYGSRTRVSTVTKNRNGKAGIRWYHALDPARGEFGPLSPEEAYKRLDDDGESDEFWTPTTTAHQQGGTNARPARGIRSA